MDGVIIEYKGQNNIRIVESATERRQREYNNARLIRIIRTLRTLSNMGALHGSQERERTHREWWQAGMPTDPKCWKNKKHARRPWMRHQHRTVNNRSARILAENCVYPNTTC